MTTFIDRVDLSAERITDRWYNVLPDLPRLPDDYVDGATGRPVSPDYGEILRVDGGFDAIGMVVDEGGPA